MSNKIKLFFLLLTTLPLAAQSAVYIEPRLSYLHLSGNPSIGDVGVTVDEDLPSAAFSLALGYELSTRVSLEFRYTGTGDVTVKKISPHWQIFPGGEVLLPVERKYLFRQHTNLFSAALPIRVLRQGKLSLIVTPMLQLEDAEVDLIDVIEIMPAQPGFQSLPQYLPILSRRDTSLRLGAEVSLGYALAGNTELHLNYTYAPLAHFDAHLIGVGLGCRF